MNLEMESKKYKLYLQPFVNNYSKLLIEGLLKNNIIRDVSRSTDEKLYELTGDIQENIQLDRLPAEDDKLIKNFLEFREIIMNVASNLGYYRSTDKNQLHLSSLIHEFQRRNAFSFPKIKESRFRDIIDNRNNLLEILEVKSDALKLFKFYGLNFNKYVVEILEYYASINVTEIFKELSFDKEVQLKKNLGKSVADLIGRNEEGSDIIIELKYRKGNITTTKEMLFKGYEYLNSYNLQSRKSNFLILITFTSGDANDFAKLNYLFRQNLEELFPDYLNNIFFVPVSTNYLHLLKDDLNQLKAKIYT